VINNRKLPYVDMEAIMPKNPTLFCDVCHLSEPGAKLFARSMASYIIENKLLADQ
jgi:hypothetical protein